MDATTETFADAVIARSRERPVVVDFWAEWCGPCHMLAPVLERAVVEREGIELVKVNVDENQALADEYAIRGIPAVKAFRDGQVVAEFVGAQPAAVVDAFLEELLAPSLLDQLRDSGEAPALFEALEAGDHERALELLLEEVRTTNGDRRERARELMVTLFRELGQEHPLALRYRRLLAATLF